MKKGKEDKFALKKQKIPPISREYFGFYSSMVEMAGTAPACKEVLSSCIPVYDSFFDTLSTTWKMTKSRRVDFVYSYSLRNQEI